MMKRTLLAATAAVITLATMAPAEARRTRPVDQDRSEWSEEQTDRPTRRTRSEARNFWEESEQPSERPARRTRERSTVSSDDSGNTSNSSRSSSSSSRESVGGRPGKWCGWWMLTQRGGGPEYNLAWNWSRWGSASGPQVGAVVVWRHHVGEITGQAANGQWIVKSGNDGGRVRERARSVSGAVFRVG